MPRPAALKQRIWFTTAREALFSLLFLFLHFLFVFAYPHPPHIRLPVFVCHSRSSIILSAPEFRNRRSSHLDFSSVLSLRLEIRTIRISLNFLQPLFHTTRTLFPCYTSLYRFLFLSCHIVKRVKAFY